MAEELSKLKGKRNVYLRAMANIEKEIATAVIAFDAKVEDKVLQMTTLRNNYDKKMAEVMKLDDAIVEIYEEDTDAENELAEILARTDANTAVITKANFYLQKVAAGNATPSFGKKENVSRTDDETSSKSKASVRLPKMELEKFDGKVQNWRSFWNRFETAIDNKDFLTAVDKFNYLLGLLNDDAKECVNGLDLTSDNYEEAKKILSDRFGNPQVVIASHMESLVNLPAVTSLSNVNQLRKMYDQVEVIVRNLKSLDMPPTSYGALLIPVLNEKIPEELRVIISRKFQDAVWNLEDMIEYVKAEIQARERCSLVALKDGDGSRRREKRPFTTASFYSEAKGLCVYCHQSHSPSKCTKITDFKTRRNILRRNARCFLCLKVGHMSKSCPSTYKCRKCNKNGHHISLCDGRTESREESRDPGNTANDTGNESLETNVTFTECHNKILLQTAVGEVAQVGGNKFCAVRLMFDSGSQRTYITDKLRVQLKLPRIRT